MTSWPSVARQAAMTWHHSAAGPWATAAAAHPPWPLRPPPRLLPLLLVTWRACGRLCWAATSECCSITMEHDASLLMAHAWMLKLSYQTEQQSEEPLEILFMLLPPPVLPPSLVPPLTHCTACWLHLYCHAGRCCSGPRAPAARPRLLWSLSPCAARPLRASCATCWRPARARKGSSAACRPCWPLTTPWVHS